MPYEPILLARVNHSDSHRLEGYRADGGYAAFERAVRESQPAAVVTQVKDSGLRGRGGAGFPTGLKWTFLPKDHPGPIYLAINADESEPATFNNRILMEKDPHQVLEGIVIHPESQTRYEWRKYGLLSQVPALLSRRASGFHPEDPSPALLLPQIAPRSVLFISGAEDSIVLPSVTAEAFALARNPKQIWIAPGAHHGDYAKVLPAEYERRLSGFFERVLLQP